MAQTSKAIRAAYDTKTYRTYRFRIRKESELNARLEQFKAAEGTSLNYLVAKLLAEHFNLPMPTAERG